MNLTATAEDHELKARHAAMWALGDYPSVATTVIPTLGRTLVEACGVGPGQRVVDVAAGSGNAAVPAAEAGAEVTATDLTPELLEAGRAAAGEVPGLRWKVGDAEDMPCRDAEWDVVLSCVGVMFAPHHELAAAELLRICRPGGTIGLISWTPEGFIGQLFATMKPYAPAPPPGAQPPPLWGSEDHVRELLGAGTSRIDTERRTVRVDAFPGPSDFREFFQTRYGPTIAIYRSLADQPERATALDAELDALAAGHTDDDGAMEWEYLLVRATRA